MQAYEARHFPIDAPDPVEAIKFRMEQSAGHSSARLLQAREFHESARSLVTLGQSKSYNSAITLMVTAAIAYADAVAAKPRGVINKQDHQSAPKRARCWATWLRGSSWTFALTRSV